MINEIGQQRFDNFIEKLIKAKPSCKSCGNVGNPDVLVGDLDDVMNNLYKVATERPVTNTGSLFDSFADFMIEGGASASRAKGIALTLRKLADNDWWETMTMGGYKLTRFEGNIPNVNSGHELDLLFEHPSPAITRKRSVEMKNWSVTREISSFQGQVDAYLESTRFGHVFLHVFGGNIQTAMRKKFADYIKAKVEIGGSNGMSFSSHQQFFSEAGILDQQDLLDQISSSNFSNHVLFNFVQ